MRDDVQVAAIPATEIADELGNTKVANVVMLGAYLGLAKLLPEEAILAVLNKKAKARPALVELNARALRAGLEFVRSNAL